jgi:hypothetical protein
MSDKLGNCYRPPPFILFTALHFVLIALKPRFNGIRLLRFDGRYI